MRVIEFSFQQSITFLLGTSDRLLIVRGLQYPSMRKLLTLLLLSSAFISQGQDFNCDVFKSVMKDGANDFLEHRGEKQGAGKTGDKYAYKQSFISTLQQSLEVTPNSSPISKKAELTLMVDGGATKEEAVENFNALIKKMNDCMDGMYTVNTIRSGWHMTLVHKDDIGSRLNDYKHPSIVLIRTFSREQYATRVLISAVDKN